MFTESSFKCVSLPFWEKRNNQAVGRLDNDLVLKTVFGRGEKVSENICFPLATQIATSISK